MIVLSDLNTRPRNAGCGCARWEEAPLVHFSPERIRHWLVVRPQVRIEAHAPVSFFLDQPCEFIWTGSLHMMQTVCFGVMINADSHT